jgi:hypothetical protein
VLGTLQTLQLQTALYKCFAKTVQKIFICKSKSKKWNMKMLPSYLLGSIVSGFLSLEPKVRAHPQEEQLVRIQLELRPVHQLVRSSMHQLVVLSLGCDKTPLLP